MLATVIALLLIAVLAGWVWRLRTQLRAAQARAARLEALAEKLAESTASTILADALGEHPLARQHRRRKQRWQLNAWLPLAGAGLLAVGRRFWDHKVATAATVAMVGTMTAWPMLSPDLPELAPPPIAAPPPPLEDYPGLPAPEPELPPEVVPPAQAVPVQPLPPAIELPQLNPVAVELPALPELPAVVPPPQATPPAPSPAPDPTPEPTEPGPAPPEPPPVNPDPLLLCYDVEALGLIRVELCLRNG